MPPRTQHGWIRSSFLGLLFALLFCNEWGDGFYVLSLTKSFLKLQEETSSGPQEGLAGRVPRCCWN